MPNRRIVILGYDGMDAGLVRSWADSGYLPNFHALLESSAWRQFDISPEYSSGMVWPTINTGLLPSEHRCYFSTRLVEGSYCLRPRRAADVLGEPFWKDFAATGHRIVVADVPFARVLPECGGLQVQGWGQHDCLGAPRSEPRHLLKDVVREFGAYPIRAENFAGITPEALPNLEQSLLQAIRTRTKLLQWLSAKQEWDVFYAVFSESHNAGHGLWPCDTSGFPDVQSDARDAGFDPLRRVYKELDDSLGQLRKYWGPDVTMMVIMSHGMGPNVSGDHLLPELLRRFNSKRTGAAASIHRHNFLNRAWQSTIAKLPARWRLAVRDRTPLTARRWISVKRKQLPGVWKRSLSFSLPGLDGFSAVRVNYYGREPNGVVQPGDEYRNYVSDLIAEIGRWTDESTGQPAVAKLHRADSVLDPANLGPAPDIMIWWNKTGRLNSVRSPILGTVSSVPNVIRSGEHIMQSLFLVHDTQSDTGRYDVASIELTDIAPFLRRIAGLETN